MLNTRETDSAQRIIDELSVVAPKTTAPARDPLLETRQTTHGEFAENARISQTLKDNLRASPGWNNLTDIERESMDMICLKFSRILSGKAMAYEHWSDVRGYALLVEEKCPK